MKLLILALCGLVALAAISISPAISIVDLSKVGGQTFSQGQKTTANSVSLTLSSDHGALPFKQSPAAGIVDAESSSITVDTLLEAATVNLRLLGYTIQESAAVPLLAQVVLRHGIVSDGNCTGNAIAFITLLGNTSQQMDFGLQGRAVGSGVCIDVIAGTLSVNIATVIEAAP